jgi:hypothetical protein
VIAAAPTIAKTPVVSTLFRAAAANGLENKFDVT